MPETNAPSGRHRAATVWTGREAIVWGGHCLNAYFGDGKLYRP